MDNIDERNGDYASHSPHRYEHPPQRYDYPSRRYGRHSQDHARQYEYSRSRQRYRRHHLQDHAQQYEHSPQRPEHSRQRYYRHCAQQYEHSRQRYHLHHSQRYEHPPQRVESSRQRYYRHNSQDHAQRYEYTPPPSRYFDPYVLSLGDPMPSWFPPPPPVCDHQVSLPPQPSFKPSRQLRASIENQTDVAMGITKQLLLTLGKDKNIVYSPLSIHVVLSMILAGTKGHIHDQMLRFLKSKSINELNDLASNVVPLVFADGFSKGGPRLSFANGVWVEKTIHVKPGFKQVLDTTYKAAFNQVDFITRAEEVRCEVNSWAENETKGLIKEIIPAGEINSETRLILANALYFKGSWEEKFDESKTRMDNFYLPNGRSVKAPFMSSSEAQFVSAFEGFKVLKLPYEQGRDYERHFSMYVFLPNARDGLQALVERVCSESGFIDRNLPKSKDHGRFLIPKFKISVGFDALEVLKHLGLHLKDLTEMVEGEDTDANKILHKSYIEVNEEGTEATAVTANYYILGCSAPRPPLIDFVADHPFLYLIREEVTGTVLFIGHVLNPIAEETVLLS